MPCSTASFTSSHATLQHVAMDVTAWCHTDARLRTERLRAADAAWRRTAILVLRLQLADVRAVRQGDVPVRHAAPAFIAIRRAVARQKAARIPITFRRPNCLCTKWHSAWHGSTAALPRSTCGGKLRAG